MALVALVAALGAGLLVTAFTTPAPRQAGYPQAQTHLVQADSVPVSTASAAVPGPSQQIRPLNLAAAPARPRSSPTRIVISRIGVDANIVPVGVASDGTLEVPPLDQAQLTGWYQEGPAPGEIGNALLVGHVDSHKTGAAVFYRLSTLEPGDTIAVTRADRSVAQFTVERTEAYPKASFPTDLVYGPNLKPALRLVTCGGRFDSKTRSYLDNVVVSATLTSWRTT